MNDTRSTENPHAQYSRRQFLRKSLILGVGLPLSNLLRTHESLQHLSYEFDRGAPDSYQIAITVDDCYDWEKSPILGRVGTQKIVERMIELRIPITYFPIGSSLRFNSAGWGKAWNEYSGSGLFELQNHTQTHQDLTSLTTSDLKWQLTEWGQSFQEATGSEWGNDYPPIVRYPGGKRNSQVSEASHQANIAGAAFWSFASESSVQSTSSQKELDRVRQHLISPSFSTGGSILLFHDLEIDLAVLENLPTILEELQLTPVLLSQLPGTVAYQTPMV